MTDGLIAGRFQLRRLLGAGGTASVFEAVDARSGGAVALKLLHPHLAADRAVWDAFFEEVRAAQTVDHPGIARVIDEGVDSAEPPVVWIAMELVAGTSLADHVADHGPLPVDAAIVVATALLDALQAAHACGVVHRDVTPANVMIDPLLLTVPLDAPAFARSVRLLDFGLADVPGRSTAGADPLLSSATTEASLGVVASVPYASPEQVSAGAVAEGSDLYQVAATLYFALTGSPPFVGDTAVVARAHLSAPPPVPSSRRSGVPRAVDRIVTTAMMKRADDRFPNAAAMAAALRAAMPEVAELPAASLESDGGKGDAPYAATVQDRTALTRVYRTSVPAGPDVPRSEVTPAAMTPAGRGGWGAPLIAVLAIASITAAVGISAIAASNAPTPLTAPPAAPTATEASSPAPPSATETEAPRALVPAITGLVLSDAVAALQREGLVLGDIAREDAPSQVDVVLGATPAVGEYTRVGSVVALRVATGRNVVPDTIGLSRTEAIGKLAAAGFGTRDAVQAPDDGGATVSAASPAAGQVAAVGTVVVLTLVARSAVPSTPTPVPTSTSTPLPTPAATPSESGRP
ncbi:MAG: protein kinase [Microbacterium sp.]|uniref:serine/threonine protein kinase n=1 Tax=Microbacterium sp. TaxID=51671 RepID=UPI001AC375EA|nr:serine/threonine-protein kinase [Microbacterium sp.]MBN9177887.1 protein kinase [Microbacterium sp.]